MKRTLITLLMVCAVLMAGCEKGEQAQTTAPTVTTAPIVTTAPTETAEATEPPHTHTYTEAVTPPTCTGKGYTTYSCECGDTYTGDEVEATGHSYEAMVTDATCTEAGYTTHTCTCGDTYTDSETKAIGHSYSKSHVTAATCTNDGYTTYSCTCGDSYTADYTDALGHKYDSGTVIDPTTESEGYTRYTCSRCGNEYKDNYTDKLPAETEPPATEVEQAKLCINKWLSGETAYYTRNCGFLDARTTWTSEITAYVYDEQSIYVSWTDKNGKQMNLYIEPIDGYAVSYILNDDGTVTPDFAALPEVDVNFG